MDQADVEGLALELYRETRMDPCKPPPILTLARSHPRIDDVIIEPLKRPGVFELTGPQRGLIRLAAHLRPWPRRYFCAHEFGEFGLEAQRRPYRGEDRERRAHQLGAALLIPAPALRAFLRDHGFDLAAMAARFRVGQVCAFLRWAELTERSVAVVGGLFVARRGRHPLPDDKELRRLVFEHIQGRSDSRFRFVTLFDPPNIERTGVIWERA